MIFKTVIARSKSDGAISNPQDRHANGRDDNNTKTNPPFKSAKYSGYVLLPVAFAIALIATIAFMISQQSGINVNMAASEFAATQAEYVAQAGLQHGIRQAVQQGCGPYTNLTNVSFDNDQYSTTLTTDLGSTTPYSISVDQDNWIRSDILTNNNASDPQLHVRFESGNIERPMLRYDLSSIAANSAILSATAWFYVSKEHPAGQVDIHRIIVDWTETDATWGTMGTNMESAVLTSIPAQPDSDVWVSVNLTAQVQAWVNGQPNYGIFMNPVGEGDHGDYASSESANVPYLQVIVASPPSSPATLQATGTLVNGISRSITRDTVRLHQQPAGTLTLQPGSEGHDAEIWAQSPDNNYGDAAETWVSSATNDTTRTLLHYDMGAIPAAANILEATLSLQRQSGSGADQPVSAHRIMNPWDEGSVTWNRRQSITNWDTAGGDFDTTAVATTPVGPVNQRYAWNITPLVQGWVDGSYPNYGVELVAAIAGMPGERFYTSDDADPSRWPSLSITYACECGSTCVAPQGSGRIAMMAKNSGLSPDPLDKAKETMLESWGYEVDIYDDNFLWIFNSSSYDAIYISATASDSTLVDQLKYEPIGIVYELEAQNNDMGMADGSAFSVGTDITITDTSHDITLPFPPGSLAIKTAASRLSTISGSAAAGAQILAETGGTASLLAIDTDGELGGIATGENAAGRRVMLPVGMSSTDGWTHLNNNGLTIINRAIEWAMNKAGPVPTGPALWLSTLNDVTGGDAPGLDTWKDGEIINFTNPNLVYEPGSTDGTFYSVMNLDNFTNGADINAIHYVGSDITIGGANSVDLLTGDILLSTADNETLTSLNSISVNDEDVFVFRPQNPGDYSSGTFIFLLDGSQVHGESDTVGISLVEKLTVVGNGSLAKGQFLFATTNRRDIQQFFADDAGEGTTSGHTGEFIDGPSLGFGSEIRGMDVAEDDVSLGGVTIPTGSILLTLNNDGSTAGDNNISVDSEDVFYLTVTTVGASPVADATLLFDGSDVNLDTSQEDLQGLSLTTSPGLTSTLPIAHWTLDEISGNTADDSAGGHDGTITFALWTDGVIAGGVQVTSADQAVIVPHDDSLSITDELTISGWMISNSLFGYDAAVAKATTGADLNYFLGTWDDEVVFGFSTVSDNWQGYYTSGANLQTSTWYHLAASFDNANDRIKIYLDGALILSVPSTLEPVTNNGNVMLGRSAIGEFLSGRLDDVRIYNKVLSDSDINALYLSGVKPRMLLTTESDAMLGGLTFTDKDIAEYQPMTLSASLFFDGDSVDLAEDIDALHVLADGTWLLSAINTIDLGTIEAENEDLVHYDPINDVATLFFDGSALFTSGSTDISAVYIMDNGHLLLTNEYPATLGGLSFDANDIVEYDPDNDTAALFFDGDAVGFSGWIDAIHLLDNGHILLSTNTPNTLGGLSFEAGDVIDYDPLQDSATFYFNDANFSSTENLRALHVGAGINSLTGGGGGGDSGCDGTYRDNFDALNWNGSNGSIAWSNPWLEVGESDGADGGDVQIMDDQSEFQLRIRDNQNGGEGVEREADLSGAGSTTLSFDYRRQGLDNDNDYVAVYASSTGTAGPWTELPLPRIEGDGTDGNYQSYSRDISAYISANTAIRLRSSPDMGNNDSVWFDNIQIECSP